MAPSSMHCAPQSKRHALCNANGRGWVLRGAVGCFAAQRCPSPAPRRSDLCAYLHPASNNPVTNNSANASFLDMPRAHTRIRISTPHVGVLITFLELAHRHFGTASTRQRTNVCLRLACASRNAGQVSRPQAQRLTSAAPSASLGLKAAPTAAGAHRSANCDESNGSPRQSARHGTNRDESNGPPQHQPRPSQQPAAPAGKRT